MFRLHQFAIPTVTLEQLKLYGLPDPTKNDVATWNFYNNPTDIKAILKPSIDEVEKLQLDSSFVSLKNTGLTYDFIARLKNVAAKIRTNVELDEADKRTLKTWQFVRDFYPQELVDRKLQPNELISICDITKISDERITDILYCLSEELDDKLLLIRQDFKNAEKNLGIQWKNYIPHYETDLYSLIQKEPAQMQRIFQIVFTYECAKRTHEAIPNFISKKFPNCGGKQICKQLAEFKKQIAAIEKNNPTHPSLPHLKALHINVVQELYNSGSITNLKYTPYPTVLTAFTTMAKKISKKHTYNEDELTQFSTKLDEDIKNLKPMSPVMKAVICGLIGAVVGSALGFVVGAAVTFWSGGFGGLPAAIAGGLVGMTVGQALITYGISTAVGVVTGSVGQFAGFFSGRNKTKEYNTTIERIAPNAMQKEATAVITSMRIKN